MAGGGLEAAAPGQGAPCTGLGSVLCAPPDVGVALRMAQHLHAGPAPVGRGMLTLRPRPPPHPLPPLQPITNPLLYGLNFILSPRPQLQQVPCPGSWYAEGEEELLPEVLAAAGSGSGSSDGGSDGPIPVPLLVAACSRE